MKQSEFTGKPWKEQWVWSLNGKTFYGAFDTLGEAKAAAIAEGKEGGYRRAFVGKRTEHPIDIIDADTVIEKMSESAYEDAGAEDYLDGVDRKARKELEKSLRRVVAKWVDKHNLWPKFFEIEDVIEIDLPI